MERAKRGNNARYTTGYHILVGKKKLEIDETFLPNNGYALTRDLFWTFCTVCNNIPSASRHFEMEDLCCLIAPRPLTVLAAGHYAGRTPLVCRYCLACDTRRNKKIGW